MAVPKLYHTYRKFALTHIAISTVVGFGCAQAFWSFYVVPKVERRNFVMGLIEQERALKKQALGQAAAEMALPAQGSYSDLVSE